MTEGLPVKGQEVLRSEEDVMYKGGQTQEKSRYLSNRYISGSFHDSPVHEIIGENRSILELKREIQKVASLDCTVFIHGEKGTGKELSARAIHMMSPRKGRNFMTIDCGSLDQELLGHELFGHQKEVFGGTAKGKKGVFDAASGGTILLKNIGDTPLPMQAKLLRVLQERTFIRVGGKEEIPFDVRVLASAKKDLKKEMDEGKFHKDLYHLLRAFLIQIPPLRMRKEDIPLLSNYFLDRYRKAVGKEIQKISKEVLSIFMNYSFPGNVWELKSAVESALIMCDADELREVHLPQRFFQTKQTEDKSGKKYATLAEVEANYILEVLDATKGNKSEAARILGINRASIWRKLKEIRSWNRG
jgi:DNA-binding NtrC family response regulator